MITVDSSVIKLTVEGGSLSDWNGANEIVASTEHNGKWILVNSKGLIFSIELDKLSPSPKVIKPEPAVATVKTMEPKEPVKTIPKLPKQGRYATTKPRTNNTQPRVNSSQE